MCKHPSVPNAGLSRNKPYPGTFRKKARYEQFLLMCCTTCYAFGKIVCYIIKSFSATRTVFVNFSFQPAKNLFTLSRNESYGSDWAGTSCFFLAASYLDKKNWCCCPLFLIYFMLCMWEDYAGIELSIDFYLKPRLSWYTAESELKWPLLQPFFICQS